jgi:hypothetical protein
MYLYLQTFVNIMESSLYFTQDKQCNKSSNNITNTEQRFIYTDNIYSTARIATIPTDNPSVDTVFYIIALVTQCDVTVTLCIQARNLIIAL